MVLMNEIFDLAIVGGGPAGASAAIYAARKRLKTIFITNEWGGQSSVSADIENWVGTPHISGLDLAKNLRTHVETYASDIITIATPELATGITVQNKRINIATQKGSHYEAKALFVASGSSRRKLDVPGAAEYDQKGLTYCASCDGPLFTGKDVAVIGGGNAAFETALQLLAYCKTVTLLNRTDTFRADEVTVAAVKARANMRIVNNALVKNVEGNPPPRGFVTGIRYTDAVSGTETLLPVEGIFVEIGLLPNTTWLGETVAKNAVGQVVVDPKTQRASHAGIWAAGDCTDGLYHQNNIAAGDAVKALEDIYISLHR